MAKTVLASYFMSMHPPAYVEEAILELRDKAESNSYNYLRTKLRNHLKQSNRPQKAKTPVSVVPEIPQKPEAKPEKQLKAEAKYFIQRMEQLRLERETREFKRKEKQIQREDSLRRKSIQDRNLLDEEKKQRYYKKLYELHKNTQDRKNKEEEIMKNHARMFKQRFRETPLYKRIEDKYKSEVVLPEVERSKHTLQMKKFHHPKLEEIKEHAHKHDELIKNIRYRNKSMQGTERSSQHKRYPKSVVLENLLEEEKKRKVEEMAKIDYKLRLVTKQKNYAHLVKEMFPPKIDYLKQQEILERNKPRSKSHSARSMPIKSYIKPRKWKQNNMIPKYPPKKEDTKPKDYLTEMRIYREKKFRSGDLSDPKKIRNLLDYELKRKEMATTHLSYTDPKKIKTNDEISRMIIDSIKSKLALIEKKIDQ